MLTPKKVPVELAGALTSTVICVALSTVKIVGGLENTAPKSSILPPGSNNVVPVPVEVTISSIMGDPAVVVALLILV